MSLAISRWVFKQIHSRNLIYNQCWEDPELDHAVLDIRPSDKIVMITSAGCNALDYLLSDPAEIHCVDMNPHQNALLELKLAALRALPQSQFYEMFGLGCLRNYQTIYQELLRERLSPPARAIWDRHIRYFEPAGPGLYYHGTTGLVARSIRFYLHHLCRLQEDLDAFQQIRELEEQATFYRERIAPKLWSPLIRFLVSRKIVLSLLGVPGDQIAEVNLGRKSGITSFIQERVDRTLTQIPIGQNYFWRVYLNGCYTPDCCPNYLKPQYYETLRSRASRIRVYTKTMTEFLQSTNEQFSIFVLLDHMDWLSSAPSLLEEEWRSIIGTAQPGARIIYRSGGTQCSYIPEFATSRLRYRSDWTEELHARDRVGTYGSFHYARVIS
jgi:S-adenosylmethionine-diacylglycerol 3-amino-3-carboxypropyl transferase